MSYAPPQPANHDARYLPIAVVIFLVLVAMPMRFWIGPAQMTGLRTFLAVMLIPLLVQLCRGRFGAIKLPDIFFIGFAAWLVPALSRTSPAQALESASSHIIEFLGAYLLGRAFIRNPDQFRMLCLTLCAMITVTLPFAAFEALTGRPLVIEAISKLPGIFSVAIISIEQRLGLERAQVLFAHPIHYGLFCSSVAAFAFIGLRDSVPIALRVGLLTLIGFCAFLSLSSGAYLSLAIQIFLIGWSLIFACAKRRWIILLICILICYLLVDLASNRTPIRVFMSYATFSSHNAYWRAIIFEWGMINVWNNPIFGLGLNEWERPSFMISGSMDNFWLVTAVRYGIPGFALLAAGYCLGFFQVMSRDLEPGTPQSNQRLAWCICFLGLTFALCTVHVWTTIYSYIFFLFGAGMWITDYPQQAGSTEPRKGKPLRETPIFARNLEPAARVRS